MSLDIANPLGDDVSDTYNIASGIGIEISVHAQYRNALGQPIHSFRVPVPYMQDFVVGDITYTGICGEHVNLTDGKAPLRFSISNPIYRFGVS